MNTPSALAPARRRRIRYVDRALQRWLAVVVFLEVAAALAAVGALYWRLGALIEDSLFRVHFNAPSSMVTALLHDGSILLLSFVALNVLALMAATVIWGRYVGAILREFVAVIEKSLRMDYSADSGNKSGHEVLGLAGQWRAKERDRLNAINDQVARLATAGEPTPESLRRLQELLR